MHIGKYRVIGLLGDGGMGRVYKVELPQIGKISALKLLRPRAHMTDLLGEDTIEAMFLSEARILGGMRHPNVAAVQDFDRDEKNRPFFCMEYHCMNLGVMIGEHYTMEAPARVMDPARAFRYADQVLAGLDRLHHAGIFHRDIKPYNVLITDADEVKLIDFGLSLLRGETRRVPETFKIGTPYYAAPEQEADPDGIDARADLYGVGVMLWRMLTGALPPDRGEKPRPGKTNELLGTCWDDFLFAATHPQRENRFSDCQQMRQALKTAYQNWQDQLEKACRLQPLPAPGPGGANPGQHEVLRKTPVKVPVREARRVFGLDSLWRPKTRWETSWIPEAFEVVLDATHRRVWQQAGTRYPVQWNDAQAYIRLLNGEGFAGFCNWRLPTVAELATLIRRASVLGDFCTSDVFDPAQARLWSADRKSFTAAWFVDMQLGYVGAADFTCPCHVRAVCDYTPEAASAESRIKSRMRRK